MPNGGEITCGELLAFKENLITHELIEVDYKDIGWRDIKICHNKIFPLSSQDSSIIKKRIKISHDEDYP